MIYGLTDDFETPDNVEDSPQPWCEFQFRDGVITYPNEGDIVWLFFEGGDIFRPVYLGTIYAGLDIDCEKGWDQFIANRPITPTDIVSYKSALRTVNQIIADPEKKLIAQDALSQFNNIMLPEDGVYSVQLKGVNEITERTYFLEDVEEESKPMMFNSMHPQYRKNFPASFAKAPNSMYIWYTVEDVPEGGDWKSVLGGWTFYTEKQLRDGMAIFPDNLRYTYYRRYQNWVNYVNESSGELDSRQPVVLNKRPYSWTFIPTAPDWFWHPEMWGADMYAPRHTHSFPFGKMNVKNRKYWKQHTILSHDGKSAIELDDNDNYERLRIDFNYGAGGLEFSRVGINGLEMWTDGIISMRAHGNLGNGEGGYASRNAVDSSWICEGCNLRLRTDRQALLEGKSMVRVTSMGEAMLRSKYNMARVVGGGGVFIGSMNGNDFATHPGIYKPSGSKFFTGIPVISAPEGECAAPMNGNFLYLDGHVISDAEATSWIQGMNSALKAIKKICEAIVTNITGFAMIGAAETIAAAAEGMAGMASFKIESQVCDRVKLAGAWDKIQVQGGNG